MVNPEPARIKLPPGAYVILGLLLDGPRSGYDLVQLVERSVAHFWPVTKAHVYAELPRLAAAGLAIGSRVEQDSLPDKVLYAATDTGRVAFGAWLTSTKAGEPRLHHPLLLKLFFGEHLPTPALLALIDEREQAVQRTLAAYARLVERAQRGPRRWTLRYGTLRLESELTFLAELREEILARRETPDLPANGGPGRQKQTRLTKRRR